MMILSTDITIMLSTKITQKIKCVTSFSVQLNCKKLGASVQFVKKLTTAKTIFCLSILGLAAILYLHPEKGKVGFFKLVKKNLELKEISRIMNNILPDKTHMDALSIRIFEIMHFGQKSIA